MSDHSHNSSGHRQRRGFSSRRLLVAAGLVGLAVGCTLTAQEFEPLRIEQADASAVPDVETFPVRPEPVPEAPRPAPGCTGAGCCDAERPCAPGQRCEGGVCQASGCEEDPSQCELPRCTGEGCGEPDAGGPAPSCGDGAQNGDETDVDCGGSCPAACGEQLACGGDGDCVAPLICTPGEGRCALPSCVDGALNGSESALDCGGSCEACPTGRACAVAADCASGVCLPLGCEGAAERCCQAPSCEDGVANGGEPAPDCGNLACGPCSNGSPCSASGQCASGLCVLARCESPLLCSDGAQSGGETDVDCGGPSPACARCLDGRRCVAPTDCENQNCSNGTCISCGDGLTNGTETDVDCGGSDPFCQRCPDLRVCRQSSDCLNQNCFNARCISCGSGVQDGTETDVDCGGADPFCRRCNAGERCILGSDCASGFCNAGRC